MAWLPTPPQGLEGWGAAPQLHSGDSGGIAAVMLRFRQQQIQQAMQGGQQAGTALAQAMQQRKQDALYGAQGQSEFGDDPEYQQLLDSGARPTDAYHAMLQKHQLARQSTADEQTADYNAARTNAEWALGNTRWQGGDDDPVAAQLAAARRQQIVAAANESAARRQLLNTTGVKAADVPGLISGIDQYNAGGGSGNATFPQIGGTTYTDDQGAAKQRFLDAVAAYHSATGGAQPAAVQTAPTGGATNAPLYSNDIRGRAQAAIDDPAASPAAKTKAQQILAYYGSGSVQ